MSHRRSVEGAVRRLARRSGPFTMGEVADEAGISRATLYRSFPSKRALLAALRLEGITVDEAGEPVARALKAVERLLLKDGFGALTMEGVAAEAGLSLRTVYRSFGDRVGMLRAFIRSRRRRVAAELRLDSPVASGEDVERALEEYTRSILEALEDGKALLRLALAAPPEVRDALREVREAERGSVAVLAAFLETQMRAGLLRKDDARTLAAAYNGQLLAVTVLLGDAGERLPARDELARTLTRGFLHGALRAAPRRSAAHRTATALKNV